MTVDELRGFLAGLPGGAKVFVRAGEYDGQECVGAAYIHVFPVLDDSILQGYTVNPGDRTVGTTVGMSVMLLKEEYENDGR